MQIFILVRSLKLQRKMQINGPRRKGFTTLKAQNVIKYHGTDSKNVDSIQSVGIQYIFTYVYDIRISQAPLRRMLYAQRMHVHTKIEGSNTLARRKSNNCTQSYTHIERHRDNVTSISKISYPYIFYILSNRKSFREA